MIFRALSQVRHRPSFKSTIMFRSPYGNGGPKIGAQTNRLSNMNRPTEPKPGETRAQSIAGIDRLVAHGERTVRSSGNGGVARDARRRRGQDGEPRRSLRF